MIIRIAKHVIIIVFCNFRIDMSKEYHQTLTKSDLFLLLLNMVLATRDSAKVWFLNELKFFLFTLSQAASNKARDGDL